MKIPFTQLRAIILPKSVKGGVIHPFNFPFLKQISSQRNQFGISALPGVVFFTTGMADLKNLKFTDDHFKGLGSNMAYLHTGVPGRPK